MLLDLLFPRRCPVCDEPVRLSPRSGDGLACPACRPLLACITEPFCLKCGKSLPENAGEYCRDCAGRSHHFDRGMALYEYSSVAGAIFRFKYKGRREYAEFFGAEISRCLGRDILNLKPDCLIPVPIHKKRLRARGYNQAAELAKVISRRLNIPLETKLIQRAKATKPLKNLNLDERQNNLKKAFKILRNDVKLKTVIIIDDIFTTGSTIDAMAEELKRANVKRIFFVTLSIGKN